MKKEKELDHLNAEISGVERALSVARAEDLETQLAATEDEAKELAEAEERLWRQAGEQIAAFAELYAQWRQVVERRERRREELRHHSEFTSLLNTADAEEIFQGAWRAPIRPLPTTFPDFLAFVVEAALDPKGLGYRAATGAMWLDVERRITSLIPDLAGDTTRAVELLRTERWSAGG